MNQFQGIIPALLTPFKKDGSVDKKALKDIVELQLSQGAPGFYITGSTGECHLLSLEERMEIAELVREATKDKAFVITQVGTPSTAASVQLAKHAASIGVDAISSLPPLYYKYEFSDIYKFYKTLAEESGLPLIIYHFPALTGVNLTLEQCKKLSEIDGVIGVKYTSPDLYQLNRLKTYLPELTVYNGHDEILIAGLAMGADSAIGSTYNFALPLAQKIHQAFLDNDMKTARLYQDKLNRILDTILPIGNFASTKYLMHKYGIDAGICREPIRNLSDSDKKTLDALIETLD
jgi:N-acetylneuraminate lyase